MYYIFAGLHIIAFITALLVALYDAFYIKMIKKVIGQLRVEVSNNFVILLASTVTISAVVALITGGATLIYLLTGR
jgi:hypothetical protein